jgi:hypothetical protein
MSKIDYYRDSVEQEIGALDSVLRNCELKATISSWPKLGGHEASVVFEYLHSESVFQNKICPPQEFHSTMEMSRLVSPGTYSTLLNVTSAE